MSYAPGPLPKRGGLASYVAAELRKLANLLADPLTFDELHAAPSKLYTGLTVLADGTDWDPGSGQGVYTYYASAWHKLG